jgi:hypothetical protein
MIALDALHQFGQETPCRFKFVLNVRSWPSLGSWMRSAQSSRYGTVTNVVMNQRRMNFKIGSVRTADNSTAVRYSETRKYFTVGVAGAIDLNPQTKHSKP